MPKIANLRHDFCVVPSPPSWVCYPLLPFLCSLSRLPSHNVNGIFMHRKSPTTSFADCASKKYNGRQTSQKERVNYGLQENRQRVSRTATRKLVQQRFYWKRTGNSS